MFKRPTRAGKKSQKVVKLCENSEPAFEQVQRARFVRRRPSGKQRVAPNVALLLIRARYFDPMTGEFTSRDPLEYVDGMSLYRGYMGTGGMDPDGRDTIFDWFVKPVVDALYVPSVPCDCQFSHFQPAPPINLATTTPTPIALGDGTKECKYSGNFTASYRCASNCFKDPALPNICACVAPFGPPVLTSLVITWDMDIVMKPNDVTCPDTIIGRIATSRRVSYSQLLTPNGKVTGNGFPRKLCGPSCRWPINIIPDLEPVLNRAVGQGLVSSWKPC